MAEFSFTIAPEPSPDEIIAADRFFTAPTEFLKGVVDIEGLPADTRAEICFAGRSNVGKSTLLNALVKRKNLARASSVPGRTQELNFFTLGARHYLVDLPGYGYAKAPPLIVARWQNLLARYLRGRATLRRAFVLVDARHGVKAVDLKMLKILNDAAVSFQIILTKIDKLKAHETALMVKQCGEALLPFPSAHPQLIATSASKHIGIDTLRVAVCGISAP